MKKMGWLVTGALVAGGVVFARGCGGCLGTMTKAPDERLASRLADTCKIARDGANNPVRGVKKLGVYLVKHGGDMIGDFGNTIAAIERIADDDKHDARAELARDRWHAVACPGDWANFDDAIQGSPDAQEMIQHVADRMGRTFEIILSANEMPALLNFELPGSHLGAKARGTGHAQVTKP